MRVALFARTTIVGHPVAILIGALARLGHGKDFAFASAPHAVDTLLHAALADALILGAHRARITALGLSNHTHANFDGVVDLAVAIVVDAVADLGLRFAHRAAASAHAADAATRTAHAARTGAAARRARVAVAAFAAGVAFATATR